MYDMDDNSQGYDIVVHQSYLFLVTERLVGAFGTSRLKHTLHSVDLDRIFKDERSSFPVGSEAMCSLDMTRDSEYVRTLVRVSISNATWIDKQDEGRLIINAYMETHSELLILSIAEFIPATPSRSTSLNWKYERRRFSVRPGFDRLVSSTIMVGTVSKNARCLIRFVKRSPDWSTGLGLAVLDSQGSVVIVPLPPALSSYQLSEVSNVEHQIACLDPCSNAILCYQPPSDGNADGRWINIYYPW